MSLGGFFLIAFLTRANSAFDIQFVLTWNQTKYISLIDRDTIKFIPYHVYITVM